jgi:hypothetical protein
MVRSQLYTPGGEFTLPDGFDYVGPYHVHVNQGAMVGGFHKASAHDRLTPSTAASRSSMRNIMQQLRSQQAPTRRGRTRSSGGSGSGGY